MRLTRPARRGDQPAWRWGQDRVRGPSHLAGEKRRRAPDRAAGQPVPGTAGEKPTAATTGIRMKPVDGSTMGGMEGMKQNNDNETDVATGKSNASNPLTHLRHAP